MMALSINNGILTYARQEGWKIQPINDILNQREFDVNVGFKNPKKIKSVFGNFALGKDSFNKRYESPKTAREVRN